MTHFFSVRLEKPSNLDLVSPHSRKEDLGIGDWYYADSSPNKEKPSPVLLLRLNKYTYIYFYGHFDTNSEFKDMHITDISIASQPPVYALYKVCPVDHMPFNFIYSTPSPDLTKIWPSE